MIPHLARAWALLSPTPHIAPTGSTLRKSWVAEAGTRSRPSGLAWEEASLATNSVEAIPTEAGSPRLWRMVERIHWAMRTGGPIRRWAPETSRKASSTLTFSSTGVTCSRMAMT
ncbi:MAG: hypothetical protein Q605_AUC01012G0002 [Actinomyces urogenitalis DORA_12]|uniref:Uncharacterized protein n=1 Tax=Actinomyces urogenitalis DORA_12 TaxID=1403939 RepID=W1VB71_9ACTO|nr:MAG: hypothetical protein Q605_AUC01012G0002 [Actinomyces urogenitalis DORA_12]